MRYIDFKYKTLHSSPQVTYQGLPWSTSGINFLSSLFLLEIMAHHQEFNIQPQKTLKPWPLTIKQIPFQVKASKDA